MHTCTHAHPLSLSLSLSLTHTHTQTHTHTHTHRHTLSHNHTLAHAHTDTLTPSTSRPPSSLAFNNLEGKLPAEWGALQNLKVLKINSNKLTGERGAAYRANSISMRQRV
jgi:hypothetical protein